MNASFVMLQNIYRSSEHFFYFTGALISKPPATEPNDSFFIWQIKTLAFFTPPDFSEKLPILNHICSYPAQSLISKIGEQPSQKCQNDPAQRLDAGRHPRAKKILFVNLEWKKLDKAWSTFFQNWLFIAAGPVVLPVHTMP